MIRFLVYPHIYPALSVWYPVKVAYFGVRAEGYAQSADPRLNRGETDAQSALGSRRATLAGSTGFSANLGRSSVWGATRSGKSPFGS
ncbi:hypothetical protein ThimaDRAFT_2199 [Thiocapsa marina 5811]|uniref:Uncharacterized protein n=1 Tax=Thiocapsa marina 5811 TaxID=768671 RepID=F9UAM9_9GAMM|nr:hypothetical protein ThimaDRAFT_2199 [Thiocapsa marina 5811]